MSIDQIVAYFQVATAQNTGPISAVSFPWPAPQLDDLLRRLGGIARFKIDYDNKAETLSLSVTGKREIHCIMQDGPGVFIKAALRNLATTLPDQVGDRLKLVEYRSTATIKGPSFVTRADVSFGEKSVRLPSFVCEVF